MSEHATGDKPDFLRKCDTYFEWGFDTGFVFVFREDSWRGVGKTPTTTQTIGLLLEWQSVDAAAQAATEAQRLGIGVPGIYSGGPGAKPSAIWALTVEIRKLASFLDSVDPYLGRLELAAPLGATDLEQFQSIRLRSEGDYLVGLLDDGCAFANDLFRTAKGTRVLWLWNQDPTAGGVPLTAAFGPSALVDFNYGGQLSRTELNKIYPTTVQSQTEAYQTAKLPGLRRSVAHGSHVMDLLTRKPLDTADIIFVQFPKAAIEDPSGLWLKRFALDGLRYVTECAGASTKTIAVNMSWGPQTGPHDGSSILEQAIKTVIVEQLSVHKRTLHFAVPAGNSYLTRTHASVDLVHGGKFDWLVPPDGHLPAFIELWWPSFTALEDAKVFVTPPDGMEVPMTWATTMAANGCWWAKIKIVGKWVKGLLVVHPTGAPIGPFACGPHGRWKIRVEAHPSSPAGVVDVYVARADHNMGATRRATASQLSDAELQAARFLAPKDHIRKEAPGSVVLSAGTLNGVGTEPTTLVAGGYRYHPLEIASYSSAGPSRGTRVGPDYACISDRSQATPGIRATGVRSGTTTVLVGTSTASPQLCRVVATGPLQLLPGAVDARDAGAGYIVPDPSLLPR